MCHSFIRHIWFTNWMVNWHIKANCMCHIRRIFLTHSHMTYHEYVSRIVWTQLKTISAIFSATVFQQLDFGCRHGYSVVAEYCSTIIQLYLQPKSNDWNSPADNVILLACNSKYVHNNFACTWLVTPLLQLNYNHNT